MKSFIAILLLFLSLQNMAQQALPNGISFFEQGAYNRPIDYKRPYGHGSIISRFRSGFSSAIGIQYKKKALFSSSLKYTYTSGKSYGDESSHTHYEEFSSDFYLGKLSGEILAKDLIGEKKALSIGAGFIFGTCIYKNINGDYHSSGVTSGNGPYGYVFYSENHKLPANFFGTAYKGFVFDIGYMIKNPAKLQSCFSIGSRIAFLHGIMPWVNGYLETEVYFTYNFWKKRKPEEPKPIEEKESPVNWNGQYNNK